MLKTRLFIYAECPTSRAFRKKNYLLKYFLPPCRITIPLAFLPTVIPAILKVLADFNSLAELKFA